MEQQPVHQQMQGPVASVNLNWMAGPNWNTFTRLTDFRMHPSVKKIIKDLFGLRSFKNIWTGVHISFMPF